MSQIIAVIVASVAFQTGSAGGSSTLTGMVRDQQGGGIPGAEVAVTCGAVSRYVTANDSGEFRIRELPAARCTATAGAPMFESYSVTVDISRGSGSATLTLRVRGYVAEVVVTPGRGLKQDGFSVPESVSVTTRRDIDSRPYQLLAQVLRDEPGILVQQTTSAQVSPIIRGFTGQSNVYLLDGVRLNTAAWRPGPSQYFGWIDAAVADRLEVVRGPASVEYGSDALGGTINVLTAPSLFSSAGLHIDAAMQAGLGSADRSTVGEGRVQLRLPRASLRFGGSRRLIGDLRGGGGDDSHAAVTRFLGIPSSIVGSRMPGTAYDQSGMFVSGSLNMGGAATLNTLFMHDNQSGASRYDRVLGGDGNYRSGFDPQRLDFGLVKYQRPDSAGFDGVAATFSVNRQADGRFEQARPVARVDAQRAATTVFGYQVQGHRAIGRQRVLVGAEFYDERTGASREFHEVSGAVTAQRPDIPDGTTYTNLGLFAQDSVDLLNGRVNVRAGLRYGRFGFGTTADPLLGVTAERVTTDAVTFQVGSVVSLHRTLNAVFNVSRGFRAANAADLGDIGLTGGGGFSITPSRAAELGGFVGTSTGASAVSTGERVPALGPEVLYSYEGGLKFRSRRVDAAVTAYDLEYFDTIQRRAIVFPAGVVGSVISGFEIVRQDAAGLAFVAQDVRPIGTRVNVDRARITGFDAQVNARISRHWTGEAHFSMTRGRVLATGEPLRRMPPPLGGARLRWDAPRVWVEGAISFAGTQNRLNSGDLTDARIGAVRTRTSIAGFFNGTATDIGLVRGGILVSTGETLAQVQTRLLGTQASGPLYTTGPGFVVLGLRAGWRLADRLELSALGENLTDRNYRLYGSGLDSPGANLQLRVRYRF